MKCKVPRDSNKFFSNNENKSRLISLTFSFIKENDLKSLQMLKCNTVILSGDCYCKMVTTEGCFPFDPLKSDQEEADTKVVLHAIHALGETTGNICIRSPSGDTDIFVIALAKIAEKNRIKMDYGNGKNRKGVWLDEIDLPANQCDALIGFHSFTGNDYRE